jgi:hypothetical protein
MEYTNAPLELKYVAPNVAEYSGNLVETFALYPSNSVADLLLLNSEHFLY